MELSKRANDALKIVGEELIARGYRELRVQVLEKGQLLCTLNTWTVVVKETP